MSKRNSSTVKFDEIEMQPFEYSAEGHRQAVSLAGNIASWDEEKESTNVAAALLIGGIAAIEDESERHAAAFYAIIAIMAKCPTVTRTMNRMMRRERRSVS